MTIQGTTFVYPRGQDPASLYQTLRVLIDTLNRQSSDGGTLPPAVQGAVDDLQVQIDTLVANGDLTPQQAFILSLVTAVSSQLGSLSSVRERVKTQLEQAADATIAASIAAQKANIGVRTEIQVRAREDQVLAERIDTVEADLGVTSANITQLTQAVTDGDNALATQITNVSSTVASNTTSVEVLTSSVNGQAARFAVTVNANHEVTGFIRLDGGALGTTFNVAVDNFLVSKVGTSGGTAVPVFAISTVGGVAKLVLRGDMIADGSITTPMIVAGAITADKILANSLAAISANLGTVTAGFIQSPDGTLVFDLANMILYRTDLTAYIDLKNKRIKMSG